MPTIDISTPFFQARLARCHKKAQEISERWHGKLIAMTSEILEELDFAGLVEAFDQIANENAKLKAEITELKK